ncbi:MAG TPA: insulinase family protein, partial [Halanaerobiales bacterium]|nr:insulinase family protein [Halanaerobiales bacterium]
NIMNVHKIIEKKNVEQGKLVMGFRTGEIKRNSELFYELLFCNALLGAFPHSRLFRKLREEASLAYYVSSWLESTKGLMVINAGIDFINYERSINIINEQLELLKLGEINKEEFSWTKKALINSYKSIADNARGLTGHYLLGLINGRKENIYTAINKIKNVRKDDIKNIAPYIKLDTIYFLDKKVE